MKQTGLFRSITEVQANCEQSGKRGAEGAQRKMSTVTYIISGREREVGQQAVGNTQLSTGGVCALLSFQVPGPGPACALSAVRAVCTELA